MQCIIYNVIQLFWMHEPNILQQSTNSYYQKKNWEMWKCIKVCYSNEDQGNHSPINERLQQFNECNETSSMDFNTFEWMDQMFYNNQPTVIGWGSTVNQMKIRETIPQSMRGCINSMNTMKYFQWISTHLNEWTYHVTTINQQLQVEEAMGDEQMH